MKRSSRAAPWISRGVSNRADLIIYNFTASIDSTYRLAASQPLVRYRSPANVNRAYFCLIRCSLCAVAVQCSCALRFRAGDTHNGFYRTNVIPCNGFASSAAADDDSTALAYKLSCLLFLGYL
jgi:hypothetical protein